MMGKAIFIEQDGQHFSAAVELDSLDGRWPRSYMILAIKFKLRFVRHAVGVYTQISEAA